MWILPDHWGSSQSSSEQSCQGTIAKGIYPDVYPHLVSVHPPPSVAAQLFSPSHHWLNSHHCHCFGCSYLGIPAWVSGNPMEINTLRTPAFPFSFNQCALGQHNSWIRAEGGSAYDQRCDTGREPKITLSESICYITTSDATQHRTRQHWTLTTNLQ